MIIVIHCCPVLVNKWPLVIQIVGDGPLLEQNQSKVLSDRKTEKKNLLEAHRDTHYNR